MIFLRNLFSMSAMRIISAGLTFSLVLAFSRIVGIAQLGQFSLLITLFLFFQLLPLLGLHLYLIREISAAPQSIAHHLPNAMILALSMSVLLALALGFGGTVIYAEQPEIHSALWLVAASLIPTAPIVVIEMGLLAQQRMNVVAQRNIFENILRTSLSLWLVFAGYGLTPVFIVFFCGRLLTAISYIASNTLPSLIAYREISRVTLSSYARNLPTFFGIALLGALSTRLDMLIMSKLSTPEQLGLYAAAYKLYEFGLMVPQIISVVIFPKMSALYAQSSRIMVRLLAPAIAYPVLGASPLLILLGFNSELIMSLFGVQATAGVPVLKLLLPALVSTGVSQLLAVSMLVLGRSDLDLRTLAITSLFTTGLLLYVIPIWGAIGAALAMLLVSILTVALRFTLLAPLLPLRLVLKNFIKTLIPSGIMLVVMTMSGQLNIFAVMALGVVAYILSAKLLGLLSLASLREFSALNKVVNKVEV
jgi:O-antigen/teichoic acid export membrane protein